MKKIISVSAVLATAMLLNASVASAWQWELENPNQDYTMELYFNPDEGGNIVNNFALNFFYDGDLADTYMTPPPDPGNTLVDTLSFVSYTHDATSLGYAEIGSLLDLPSHDLLYTFSGDGGVDGVEISGRTLFCTVTFSGDAVGDGYQDMWFAKYDNSFASTVDFTSFNIIDAPDKFQNLGTDVNPVPIPGTLLILGSGLMGLLGIKRKKLSA